MIRINFDKECYGCGACAEVCPKKCISFKEDEKGFLKAYIDESQCINCGLCDRKCIATYKNEHNTIHSIKAMYGYNLDDAKRKNGTSGGVFLELALACLQKGYLISGCVWDENWNPIHVLTDSLETVEKMQRSKYAQSDLSGVLKPIKDALSKGKKIMFSGTPCQIAALKSFVGENDNILYVGVVCHGVASRKIWRMYLDSLSSQFGNIKQLRMREKLESWASYGLFVEFENGKQLILSKPENGQFIQCFLERLYVSERCMSCQYKGDSISADIILGDGWGQNPVAKSLEDGKGHSCILVKSEKGEELWNEVNSKFCTKDTTAEVIAQGNPRLVSPSAPNPRSKRFYNEVEKNKYVDAALLNKYMYINTPVAKIKKMIRKVIKR